MQKHVNLLDLVKSFPTNIFLQNFASIQPRTSPIKFAHLAEKSEEGSISNLSTKVQEAGDPAAAAAAKQEKLPTSSPQERADVAEMKGLVEDLWGPDGTGERSGAVHSAGLSHGNAKIAAGKA